MSNLSFRDRIRLMREYNSLRRDIRRQHPEWSEEEVCAEALELMKAKYGDDPDWSTILQMILEFLMKLLPFFFLAEKET